MLLLKSVNWDKRMKLGTQQKMMMERMGSSKIGKEVKAYVADAIRRK